MVKYLVEFTHTHKMMQLTSIFCFCDIQHFMIIAKIVTDNIPGHIRILEMSYNF